MMCVFEHIFCCLCMSCVCVYGFVAAFVYFCVCVSENRFCVFYVPCCNYVCVVSVVCVLCLFPSLGFVVSVCEFGVFVLCLLVLPCICFCLLCCVCYLLWMCVFVFVVLC